MRGPRHQDILIRVAARTEMITESGCWIWHGATSCGYGTIEVAGKTRLVHRVMYERLVGPIPKDKQLDHKCRVLCCWNPDHLEPVTSQTNTLRGFGPAAVNARKNHCAHGHELSGCNLGIRIRTDRSRPSRVCLICARRVSRESKRRTRSPR